MVVKVAIGPLTDGDTLPESNSISDDAGCFTGFRIIPRRIFEHFTLYHHIVIARRPLPVTDGMVIVVSQVLPVYGLAWEVMVAFYQNRLVTFG